MFCRVTLSARSLLRRTLRPALFSPMATDASARTYAAAIEALNSLQSNAATLETQRKTGGRNLERQLPDMAHALEILGIQLDDLNGLKVIHVAGSKGKGSTCAFVERILREHGLKTGLFTSPHLIEVRERIRINGQPLSQTMFAEHFWRCHDRLRAAAAELPPYFRFTALMTFQVFLAEKVDVAILEVGMGGRYDATNIVPRPVVCGIASLALEHTAILGSTIPEIAFHKGGIIKHAAPVFTAPQPPGGLETLLECATAAKTRLHLAPPLEEYSKQPITLGLVGDHQRLNASLALQLTRHWLAGGASAEPSTTIVNAPAFEVTDKERAGLANTQWPGRCQIVELDGVTYLLDGAHTLESCEAAAAWFKAVLDARPGARSVLLFNCAGDREGTRLLPPLVALHAARPLAAALFCPNRSRDVASGDHINKMARADEVVTGPAANAKAWLTLTSETPCTTEILPYIDDAIETAQKLRVKGEPLVVLVTGSLHLVGGTLKVLEQPVQ
eukprot:m.44881 g.44881  ORF g.44881 m.44881 type:complete len:503 (+) comp5848_c0_seq1:6-1514(+)